MLLVSQKKNYVKLLGLSSQKHISLHSYHYSLLLVIIHQEHEQSVNLLRNLQVNDAFNAFE